MSQSPKFFKSTKNGAKKQHYHLIYVDPQTGRVSVAESDGHTHEAIKNPDGSLSLSQDPLDAHAHEIEGEFKPKLPKKKKEPEEDVVSRVYSLFKVAWELECKSIEAGRESEKFYAGEQWEESVKRELESQGRAALTINLTEKFTDDLIGYQRQQRSDITYYPIEQSDQATADLYNIATKVILSNCDFEREESEAFEDLVIAGRGNFNVYVDTSKDFRGDIKVERYPWDQVVYGPHEKLDASDADYVVKYQFMSLERLRKKYPKKTQEIDRSWSKMNEDKSIGHIQYSDDQYAMSDNTVNVAPIPTLVGGSFPVLDVALKEMRVFELQEKLYEDVSIISDPAIDYHLNAFGWSETDIKQAQTIPGLFVTDTKLQQVRITRVVGDVLLSDENPADVPENDFYIIPVYGKKKKGKFWGRLESAKDPQREVNKRISQALDIGNKMAAYGWFIDDMTFPSRAEEEQFRKNSSRPGFVQRVTVLSNPPQKVEGVEFPSEIANLTDMSQARLQELLSVSATQKAGANTSAEAILQVEKSILIGQERLFDNMSFSKRKLGRLLIKLIGRYYDAARLYRIVSNQAAKMAAQGQPMNVAGQPFEELSEDVIMAILETADVDKLDVVVGESQWTPTQRIAVNSMLGDLLSKGAPVPFEIFAETLDMPQDVKGRMIQSFQQSQQAQAAGEQQKYDAEIEKSLIGQGVIPPGVAQKYQIAPQPAPPQQELPPGINGQAGPIGLTS